MEEKNEMMAAEQPKRFTYEQLEQIAANLSSQVQQLSTRLQEASMFNVFKRLDYCFKVVEIAPTTTLFNPEFVTRCAEEIEELMALPAPVTEDTSKEEE